MKQFLKNKLSIIAFTLIGILFVNDALAQQDPEYTHYMFNGLALNPSYAGSREVLSAFALYRTQWVNLDKAPQTISVSAHMPIGTTNNNVGLSIISDNLGAHSNIWINADYAYRWKVETGKMSLGIRGQLLNRRSDYTDVEVIVDEPLFGFGSETLSATEFDIGLGFWYGSKTFYLGASMPHLLNQKNLFNGSEDSKQVNHTFITAGYVVPLTSKVKFKPSVLVKTAPNSPLQIDLNAMFLLMDQFWAGIGLRSGDSVNFLFDAEVFDNFRVGYSYDLTTSKWREARHRSTHEIIIGYDYEEENTKVLTPRYF